MSKIGKQIIKIPEGVTVTIQDDVIQVKAVKGIMNVPLLSGVQAKITDGEIAFTTLREGKQIRSNWGTTRALVYNAVEGLTKGYQKTLMLEGVGFRVTKEGNDLVMNLGFSHPIRYSTPPNIVFEIEKNSTLKIFGFDKALVGQVAAKIRSMKKPEPYKGKGFRYSDEVIRRKAGKKAASATGGA